MIRILNPILALCALGVFAAAQTSPAPAPSFALSSFEGPIQSYELNAASGKLTKVGDPQLEATRQEASTPSYLNNCTIFTFLTTGTSELVDWGVKAGGASGLVDSFAFGYATTAIDPASGGPGASMDIAFYTGTLGSGTLGTQVARYSFTGLPGSTDGVTPGGFFITIDLTTTPGFCLPDGPIGYGYCSTDIMTGPILVDILAPACAGNGTADAFDDYVCPASSGAYNGTFFLGGPPTTASFWMEINEDDATEVATTTPNNGTGVNPVLLSDGGVPAIVGATWPAVIDNTTSGYNSSFGLWTVGSIAAPLFLAGGEVIINILDPNGFVITNAVIGTGFNDHSVLVVKGLDLIGVDLTCQGLLFGGLPGYQLTNAIEIHLGF